MNSRRNSIWIQAVVVSAVLLGSVVSAVPAAEPEAGSADAGWRHLREHPFLPFTEFEEETLDQLWTVWPPELQEAARAASPAERRRMIFEQYGLHPLPGPEPSYDAALGYVQLSSGWMLNCLICHGGQVNGQVIPGLANSDIDLESLAEDTREVKRRTDKLLTNLDQSVGRTLLSDGPGMTNAVNFGIIVGSMRRADMGINLFGRVSGLKHYGVDAPAFWNVKYKQRLYYDNHAPKYHRVLMQFMLHPFNKPERITSEANEQRYRDILAWIESREPPPYPFPVDQPLAAKGEAVFNRNCASCHGTYRADGVDYPEKVIPLSELGTDPVRLEELKPEYREWLTKSWLTDYGKYDVNAHPAGYVAPPLKGIWASGPYLHNGSVPTLWHVLHPDERPPVWKRRGREFDRERIGFVIDAFESLPDDFAERNKYERRRFYDTAAFGKSAAGHDYPNALSEDERRAVLEYLKTL